MIDERRRIAIFASGNGSNAEAIIQHLSDNDRVAVSAIYSNNPAAYVLERAKNHQIPAAIFTKTEFYSEAYIKQLISEDYDLVVLAGFMWLIPDQLVAAYPHKIINIHPALLPKYGGKGMYGDHVHQAVLQNKELESGITIHYVNENYDEGDIIIQERCEVRPDDTPETLAHRIHQLEHKFYPQIVEDLSLKKSP